jgi:hypothetical protein
VRLSPGASSSLTWCEPTGCQPWAIELADWPRSTTTGLVPAAVGAQEGLALGVETGQRLGAGKVGKVIAALAVLGLVVDDLVFHFHLAGAEVALEVGGVVQGIPQAELDEEKGRQLGGFSALVGDRQLPDFQVFTQRHKVAHAAWMPWRVDWMVV